MGMRAGMIKCGNCGKMVQDTLQEEVVCQYCGKRTNREEAMATSEEEVRRRLIWDISDNIRKFKAMRNAGFAVGSLLLLFSFLILFSNLFTLKIQIIFIVAFITGLIWLFIGFTANRRSETSIGKMLDFSSEAADTD